MKNLVFMFLVLISSVAIADTVVQSNGKDSIKVVTTTVVDSKTLQLQLQGVNSQMKFLLSQFTQLQTKEQDLQNKINVLTNSAQ